MSDFNYFDELRNGGTQDWISYVNSDYINKYAPQISIFKLDKENTLLDEVYNEEISSRIYLPPFPMRAMHLDNEWQQILGSESMPYLETQENILFVVNFQDMVSTIRDLKTKHINDISVSYIGTGTVSASKLNGIFTIKINDVITHELSLSTYNTTAKLVAAINNLSNFSAVSTGSNDDSDSIVSFNETTFTGKTLTFYSPNNTYQNSTEVLEKGDLILTNKWFLYEVLSNLPGGNIGWSYSTFMLKCNLRSLDKAQLPSYYLEQIRKNEYGLRSKIDME